MSTLVFALAFASCLAVAPRVFADASVRVELKRKDGTAVDGVVRIKQGEMVLSCTTHAGACVISAPAGGSYEVQAEVPGIPQTKPKTAMIPPSGNVKLVVAVD